MRLSDVVGGSGLAIYAQVALVLFLVAFSILAVRLLIRRDRAELDRMSRMPLDDGSPEPADLRSDAMSEAPRPAARDDKRPDRILDHEYDGIREYDNPLPRWWINLFWATILFAILYVINVPGIGSGRGRIAQYEQDMARAMAQRESLAARAPAAVALDDDALIALSRDPVRRKEGGERFAAVCAPCHRADGGGGIGPNLTDEFWIHGGRPSQMLKLVNEGVPDKGMPTWSESMKPDEIATVVAYILTLRGTRPPDPKGPEGEALDGEN